MNDKILVNGGKELNGEVEIEGAKNAVLPILASSLLLNEGESLTLTNVPNLSDVRMMLGVLDSLNMLVERNEENKMVKVTARKPCGTEASYEYVSKMRASSIVLGAILAKEHYAKISMPGGCSIGSRPLDLHFKGLRQLGAEIKVENGYIIATSGNKSLKGNEIYLDFPSVGATQNILMASVLTEGTTVITNVAREPEITDLIEVLNKMGARIEGKGTDTLIIEGVTSLKSTSHSVMQDRIEAGTFMVATAVVGGNVFIKNAVYNDNKPLINKLIEMGVEIHEDSEGIEVISTGKLKSTNVKTLPYPGFPTDLQSPMTLAQLISEGDSIMEETVFENRFMHLEELRRMGANFKINKDIALLYGNTKFQGAEVKSTDLRASATLIIAGMIAQGTTTVTEIEHLDRGYTNFVEKLYNLGANIERITV